MLETRVRSLDREGPLEKEMATHSSILAWRIPWTEEPRMLQSMGMQKVRHDWANQMFFIAPCILKAAPKLAFFNPKALIGQKSRKQAYYSFLFLFFWLHWLLIPAHRLSQVTMNRICSLLRWAGFSLWWLLLLPSTGSRHTGFSVCSTEPH